MKDIHRRRDEVMAAFREKPSCNPAELRRFTEWPANADAPLPLVSSRERRSVSWTHRQDDRQVRTPLAERALSATGFAKRIDHDARRCRIRRLRVLRLGDRHAEHRSAERTGPAPHRLSHHRDVVDDPSGAAHRPINRSIDGRLCLTGRDRPGSHWSAGHGCCSPERAAPYSSSCTARSTQIVSVSGLQRAWNGRASCSQ